MAPVSLKAAGCCRLPNKITEINDLNTNINMKTVLWCDKDLHFLSEKAERPSVRVCLPLFRWLGDLFQPATGLL